MCDLEYFFKNSICSGISQTKCPFIKDSDHIIKTFNKGEFVVHQNERIDYLYILSKGKVRTEMFSESGVVLEIEEIHAPNPLAAAFLFAEDNRFPVDVIAMEALEVIIVSKDFVIEQFSENPKFMQCFMSFNAGKMQFLADRLRIFSYKNIKQKLVYYISQRLEGDQFVLGRNLTSLADYFGVTRPSLSRSISEMVDAEIIQISRGKGKILNHDLFNEILMANKT